MRASVSEHSSISRPVGAVAGEPRDFEPQDDPDRAERNLADELSGHYGAQRLEAAAERALEIGARTYGSVKSILDNKLDRRPAPRRPADTAPIRHSNIRGPRYYN